MQLLLDHLGATIIAGTVILMVVTMQLRAQQTALEEAAFFRGKARTMEFAKSLSREFPQIGQGISGGGVLVGHRESNGRTTQFVYATTAGVQGGGSMNVTYTLVQDTTVQVETWDEQQQAHVSEDITLYRLERTEGSGTARTVMSDIREWKVELLDADGDVTGVLADVRQLQVRVKCMFTFGAGDTQVVHQTVWGTTFQPTGLRL